MEMAMLHKVYGCIIAVILLVACFVGYKAFKAHDAWKDLQKDLAVSQQKIAQNNQVEKQATVVETKATSNIAADTASNAAINADNKQQMQQIQNQLASKPDATQIIALVKAAIPSLTVSNSNGQLSVDDSQANRDAINVYDASYKSCKFDLDDCQKKQANYLDIIKQKDDFAVAQTQTIAAKQSDIDELTKNLKEATAFGKGGNIWARTGRVLLPVGCASVAAWGASQAKADPRTTIIAAGASGAVCAFKF